MINALATNGAIVEAGRSKVVPIRIYTGFSPFYGGLQRVLKLLVADAAKRFGQH
jgi:hypothetical protein